jgi:hypothetical protein
VTIWKEIPLEVQVGLRERLRAKIAQNSNWTAPIPDVVYHGTDHMIWEIVGSPHYLADDKPVVFGTTHRAMSLVFMGRWVDAELDFSSQGDGPPPTT